MAASDIDPNILRRMGEEIVRQLRQLNTAASSANSSPREGRGGRIETGNRNLDKSLNKFQRELNHTTGIVGSFRKAFWSTTSATRKLEERFDDLAQNIGDNAKTHKDMAEKMAQSTLKSIRAQGVNSESMLKNARILATLNDSLDKLKQLSSLQEMFEKERSQKEKIIASAKENLDKLGNEKKKEREVIQKKLAEYEKELKYIEEQMKLNEENLQTIKGTNGALTEFLKNLEETSPILESLNEEERKLIKTGEIFEKSLREQAQLLDKVNELTRAGMNAHAGAADINTDIRKSLNQSKVDFAKGVVNFLKTAGPPAVSSAFGALNAQLRNGITESNYSMARQLGMGDADLSEILGANMKTFAVANKSKNPMAMAISGDLEAVTNSFHDMGFYGKEAAELAGRLATSLLKAGVAADKAALIAQGQDITKLANTLNITRDQAIDMFDQLSQSGMTASLAMQIDEKDSHKRREILMEELRLRARNNQALGKSTEQLEEQYRQNTNTKFGEIQDIIRKDVGVRMAAQQARRAGVSISADDERILRAGSNGNLDALTPAEADRFNLLAEQMNAVGVQANRSASQKMARNGDLNSVIQAAIPRTIIDRISPNGIGSSSAIAELYARKSSRDALFANEDAMQNFLETGELAGNFAVRTAEELEKSPRIIADFNNSLIVAESAAHDFAEFAAAWGKNPVTQGLSVGNILSGAGNLAEIMVAYKMLRGAGGMAGGAGVMSRLGRFGAWGASKVRGRGGRFGAFATLGLGALALAGGGSDEAQAYDSQGNPIQMRETNGHDSGFLGKAATFTGVSALAANKLLPSLGKGAGFLGKAGRFIAKAPILSALAASYSGAYEGYNTDTGVYAKRFGIDYSGKEGNTGLLNMLYGVEEDDSDLMLGYKELQMRSLGVMSDVVDSFVENLTFGFVDPIEKSVEPVAQTLAETPNQVIDGVREEMQASDSFNKLNDTQQQALLDILGQIAENTENTVDETRKQGQIQTDMIKEALTQQTTAKDQVQAMIRDAEARRGTAKPAKVGS